MGSFVRLQSDIVRTGGQAYHFLAENDVAYLQTVGTRLGFGLYMPAGQSGQIPLAQLRFAASEVLGTANITPSKTIGNSYAGGNAGVYGWTKGWDDNIGYVSGNPSMWVSSSLPAISGVTFAESRTIYKYKIYAQTSGYQNRSPKSWTLEGSDDGVEWTVVDTHANQPDWAAGESREYFVTTPVAFTKWRINQTASAYGSAGGWLEVYLYEIEQSTPIYTLYFDTATNKLQIVNEDGAIQITETTQTFAPDAWHYLEFANGELRYNGVTIATWTPVGTIESLRLGLVELVTAEFYADDIVVSTGEEWPGPVRCHLLQPNEDIEETGWSRLPAEAPTAYSTLTDGDDASYLYSQQGLIRVGLEDLLDQNEILAVQMMSRLSVDAEGETDIDFLLDDTIVDTQALTTTPTWYTHIAAVNPATSVAWTAEEVNALGLGWMMVVVPDAPTNLTVQQGVAASPGVSTDLLPTMTGTTTSGVTASANSYFGGSAIYDAWRAFNKNTTDRWVVNVAYPHWVQIQLPQGKRVTHYTIASPSGGIEQRQALPRDWTFQGSNDGSNWTVIDTQSGQTDWIQYGDRTFTVATPGTYTYYRLHITANDGFEYGGLPYVNIWELELVEVTGNTEEVAGGDPANFNVSFDPPAFNGGADIIEYEAELTASSPSGEFMPAMTADNVPAPYVVSASSIHTVGTYQPFKVFDDVYAGTSGTGGWYSAAVGFPHWLKIDLGTARTISGFYWSKTMLTHTYAHSKFPKNFQVQGSNDNVNWTVLLTVTGYVYPGGAAGAHNAYVDLTTTGNYRYYRWWITLNQDGITTTSGSETSIDEIRLVESNQPGVTEVKTGVSSPITFLAKPYDKTYTVRARARNIVGWSIWTESIDYTHLSP